MFKKYLGRVRLMRAFTLLEMMLILFIIITIAAITVVNLRSGSSAGVLKRSAARVALDVRRAQNLSFTSFVHQGQAVAGYGVYFSTASPNSYILFADIDGNNTYSGAGENVEVVRLENGIYLFSLVPTSPLIINFRSPAPTTYIWQGSATSSSAAIHLRSNIDPSLPSASVLINDFGLVHY